MSFEPPIAVLDACVLAGTWRRLVVMALAKQGALRPVVSDRILFETRRAIPKTLSNSSMTDGEKIDYAEATIAGIKGLVPDQFCAANLPQMNISLPDQNDLHVLALAIDRPTSLIVTENTRDFPKKALAPFGIHAVTTDRFAVDILESQPEFVQGFSVHLQEMADTEFSGGKDLISELKRVGLKRVSRLLSSYGT